MVGGHTDSNRGWRLGVGGDPLTARPRSFARERGSRRRRSRGDDPASAATPRNASRLRRRVFGPAPGTPPPASELPANRFGPTHRHSVGGPEPASATPYRRASSRPPTRSPARARRPVEPPLRRQEEKLAGTVASGKIDPVLPPKRGADAALSAHRRLPKRTIRAVDR